MRSGDDIRFMKLLRDYPDFPLDFVQQLYRLDRLIDELKYRNREIKWERQEVQKKRDEIVEKAIAELEKIGRLPEEKKKKNGK